MTGKPAARQTDMTMYGGPITQGSLTVYIGSAGGVACSACPGGVAEGNPVNPLLGAKVQTAEIDVLLPGTLPFAVSREYSSHQTDTPAPVGLLGPGWWLPAEASMRQAESILTLNDSKGRSIRFGALAPGQSTFSRSENLWIVRGGLERLDKVPQLPVSRLSAAWEGLHRDDRLNTSLFFVCHQPQGPWWIFGPRPARSEIEGQRLHLLGLADRLGHTHHIHRDETGAMTAVQDGCGRQFRLELKVFPLLRNEGMNGWGADSGVRLAAVHLVRDPLFPDQPLPVQPLVRYEYSPRGELTAVHGREGDRLRQFRYHEQAPGRMTAHAYPGRPEVSYLYDQHGKVVEQRRQGEPSLRFEYLAESTIVTDSLGRKRTYHFEGEAGLRRVVGLERADGSITRQRYDASGRLVASIDALGRETRFELDVATGDLISVTAPDGAQNHWRYDDQGQLIASHAPGGASESFEYDQFSRPIATTDALGHVSRMSYPDERTEQPHLIQDARGGEKRMEWNAAGLLTRQTDCSGSVTRYRYDRFGQLLQVQGEEGSGHSNEFDGLGRLTAHVNAAGQRTSYAYNEAGDLLRQTMPGAVELSFERDAQGRVLAYGYGGLVQRCLYDAAGRLARLTNENGAHIDFEHDVMDRLVTQRNLDGRVQQQRFNAAGEVIETIDAGRVHRFAYDKGGRLISHQTGEGETLYQQGFSYAQDGRLIKAWHRTELGGNEISVQFERDKLGRVLRETQAIKGPAGEPVWRYSVAHAYDAIGVETRTEYDGLPAVTWQTYGSGHLHGVLLDGRSVIDFERDKLHRETRRTFGEVSVGRSYDALSRLMELSVHSPLIQDSDAESRTHHYDARGQLVRIDTAQGPLEYGYSPAGRLIRESLPGREAVDYRFDPAGNRIFSAQIQSTEADNWEETVRQNVAEAGFNVLGKASVAEVGGGEQRWLDNRILDDGEYRYEYDDWGNLRRKYKPQGSEQHHFFYDSVHRLVRYTLESDQAVRGANYHYDPLGRRVCKQVQNADGDGQLTGEMKTLFYGWDGQRLIATGNAAGEKYEHTLYQPHGFVPMLRVDGFSAVADTSLSTSVQESLGAPLTRDQIQLIDSHQQARQPIAQQPALEWNAYLNDHKGQPISLFAGNGTRTWIGDSDVWGRTVADAADADSSKQSIRLQGQHWDEESGLSYNYLRFYSASLGRYITQDPIGLSGGVNFYAYPLNPAQLVDPLGLKVTILGGDPEQIKKLEEAYARVKKTKRGGEICKTLENSKTNYYIRPLANSWHYCSVKAAANPANKAACPHGGNTVYMDTENAPALPEGDYLIFPTMEVIMGHELGHATGTRDAGRNGMDNVIRNENPIRAELGIPPRTSLVPHTLQIGPYDEWRPKE
ncbi:RHS repeat-associated core domain-containing protein [Diaphorobacter caeni]|uniref:RHS repeat-associated core domain-containing protein n=1 Tax=Diaphorobacter caeni TaxID=2784387 RepID=UPI00188F8BC8|nr:RHS repeat-associated core domain-containing protein [Diaphorobacter caeni]MBF5007370.1 hypothetical protein [Diaphorobacter caeni]